MDLLELKKNSCQKPHRQAEIKQKIKCFLQQKSWNKSLKDIR